MILKHISGMLCLLISYSKFTRSKAFSLLIAQAECVILITMICSLRINRAGKGEPRENRGGGTTL